LDGRRHTLKKLLQKNIGFEFEIATNLTKRKLQTEFNKATGWKCKVERDPSIDAGSLDNGWEIQTPPTPAAQAIRKLKRACKFFQNNEVKTNYTTGLHINISFKSQGYNFDIDGAKLQVIVDDIKWLQKFDRMENEYCESPKFYITKLKNELDEWSKDKRRKKANRPTAESMVEAIKQSVVDGDTDLHEKYCSVNLTHLDDKSPYIEFRAVGGPSYHWRHKDIEKAIYDFSKAMDQSIGTKYDYLMKRYVSRMCQFEKEQTNSFIPH